MLHSVRYSAVCVLHVLATLVSLEVMRISTNQSCG
jgi:hypothetical protein